MTTKTKTSVSTIKTPLDLIKGVGGKVSLKGVTVSDVRVKTDMLKLSNKHGIKEANYRTINTIGLLAEVILSYSIGFDVAVKVAYTSKDDSRQAKNQSKSMTIFDVINNAELTPDFFNKELGEDLVENHSIIIKNEQFRERLRGIESSLCQYWDDEDEKTIYIDNDADVHTLLAEYHHAFNADPEPKRKHFTKKLLAEIEAAVKVSTLKFLSE